MFHKEGFKIIINTFLLCAAIALLAEYRIDHFWIQKSVQILSVVILVLVLQFFRNPKRVNTLNIKKIKSADFKELMTVAGINEKIAKEILDKFKND